MISVKENKNSLNGIVMKLTRTTGFDYASLAGIVAQIGHRVVGVVQVGQEQKRVSRDVLFEARFRN